MSPDIVSLPECVTTLHDIRAHCTHCHTHNGKLILKKNILLHFVYPLFEKNEKTRFLQNSSNCWTNVTILTNTLVGVCPYYNHWSTNYLRKQCKGAVSSCWVMNTETIVTIALCYTADLCVHNVIIV